MQEKGDKSLFVENLKAMLDWYTVQATDEEYDEDSVKNILSLLDSLEPIKEEEIPQPEAAWERFRQMAEEELPKRMAVQEAEASIREGATVGDGVEDSIRVSEPSSSSTAEAAGEDFTESAEKVPAKREEKVPAKRTEKASGTPGGRRHTARFMPFVARHKFIAAAILVLLILTVSGTAHAIATQGSGFFFWLKRDDTGTKMMVSPEGLNGVAELQKVYQSQSVEDLPEWAQEWSRIADKVEMPEGYEFQFYEVNEFNHYQGVVGYYLNPVLGRTMLLGEWRYYGKVSYNSEGFDGYSYVQSYEVNQTKLEVFNREEEGNIFYLICFYQGNCRYMVKGQEDLDEVKQLAEQYLSYVQENL